MLDSCSLTKTHIVIKIVRWRTELPESRAGTGGFEDKNPDISGHFVYFPLLGLVRLIGLGITSNHVSAALPCTIRTPTTHFAFILMHCLNVLTVSLPTRTCKVLA